jgi:hypothetical protein
VHRSAYERPRALGTDQECTRVPGIAQYGTQTTSKSQDTMGDQYGKGAFKRLLLGQSGAQGHQQITAHRGGTAWEYRSPHELCEKFGRVECQRCCRYSSMCAAKASLRVFAASPCLGSFTERAFAAADAAVGDGRAVAADRAGDSEHKQWRNHTLYRSGPVLWCRVCGAYAEKRLHDLRRSCAGPAAAEQRQSQLGALLAGRHPSSGQPLERAVPVVRLDCTDRLTGVRR